ncbi:MAG: hypothetical protein GIW95_08885 [Candidatus Eremiobacteraeota bacterium]|nr:hypothetical protein [Candidatus Eremiobacteraeota bacterium]
MSRAGIFDVGMSALYGVPVVERIHSRSVPLRDGTGPDAASDYRFADVSFPKSLPEWYFMPETYRAHIAEAPER